MTADVGKLGDRPARPRGSWGFSLVELLVTLSIAAILLALAVPNMQDAALNGKLRSQANAFLASLHLARSEAIKRNGRVVVCKSATGTACTTDGGWEQGWIVFHDRNNDSVSDPDGVNDIDESGGGDDELTIERQQALSLGFLLRGGGNVANYISFAPSGSTVLTSGAFQAGSVTLCRSQPTFADKAKQIVISPVGRARVCDTNPLSACPPPSLAENCQ